jgi:predicted acylesterase/phospholipase RssA
MDDRATGRVIGSLCATLKEKAGMMSEQHQLLSIDGGGIRGVLALEILSNLEQQLAEARGVPREDFRLCDYFDYVAGTSTGAAIAACLSRGMSTSEVMDFYTEFGPSMFDSRIHKKAQALIKTGALFDTDPLEAKLKDMLGENTTLEPGNLRCHLLAVTRNQTTDSPWPMTSNPAAKYNRPDYPDSNLKIPLWQIVRASAAAPGVFQPEDIQLKSGKSFMFLDGGVTPHNNPAWLLFRMATEPFYRMNWETGESNLLLVSVGTGSSPKGDHGELQEGTVNRLWTTFENAPGYLIQAASVEQDTNCRQFGRCVYGARIDSELGDMIPRTGEEDPDDTYRNRVPLDEDLGRKFLYARYNVHMDRKNLDRLGLNEVDPEDVKSLSSVDFIDELREIGRRYAKEIDVKDFQPFLNS